MRLTEKRIRKIIREEIVKKHRLSEADSDDKWKEITKILGVRENPTEEEYDNAWDEIIEKHYKQISYDQPTQMELLSKQGDDVIEALGRVGEELRDEEDIEKKIHMFLQSMRDVKNSIMFRDMENWGIGNMPLTVELTLDDEGIIDGETEEWESVVKGIRDNLDDWYGQIPVSEKDLDALQQVYDALKGKKATAGGKTRDALTWLNKSFHAKEKESIADKLDSAELDDDALVAEKADELKSLFSGVISESQTIRRDKKTRLVIRDMIRRQIRQINEAPKALKSRFISKEEAAKRDDEGWEDAEGEEEEEKTEKKKSRKIRSNPNVKKMQEILISEKAVSGGLPEHGADGQWGLETDKAFRQFVKNKVESLENAEVASKISTAKWGDGSSIASETFEKTFAANTQGAYAFVKFLSSPQSAAETEEEEPESSLPAEEEGEAGAEDSDADSDDKRKHRFGKGDKTKRFNVIHKRDGTTLVIDPRRGAERAFKEFMKTNTGQKYGRIKLHNAQQFIKGKMISQDDFFQIPSITGHADVNIRGKGTAISNQNAWDALVAAGMIRPA